jgi:hypothetical protein
MSFEFLKTHSQLLETGLQTPIPSFLETSFPELLLKTSFYKNSIYANTAYYSSYNRSI